MAVFVDLDDESEAPEPQLDISSPQWATLDLEPAVKNWEPQETTVKGKGKAEEARANPNLNITAQALGCYPIAMSIASHIDLNTLDALSITCRQIRANLLQFRTQLLSSTLHCVNEDVELDPDHTLRYRARAADWYFVEAGGDTAGPGKVGDCARDLVGGCRRCGIVVCRNCTIKPPAPILLLHRHRRICKACSCAPISSLIGPSIQPDSFPTHAGAETVRQAVCTCPSAGVWLCQPCGRSLRSADSEYESIWKWRTRYLPSLGGLGVGIGEGNRGVPCGRGGECVVAREVEQETDCDAEDAREFDSIPLSVSPSSSPGSGSSSVSHGQMGPGYARHEIEGIGGVVKRKLVKMVKVGAGVPEFGDEREIGKFLVREMDGRARSWCGWCWRVIPGRKDSAQLAL